MKFKMLSPGYDYKKNREQQLSIVTGLFEPTLSPKCRVPFRGTRHQGTKFGYILHVEARSEHRRQFRFCWDIYDVAGMSIRTPASLAGRYPMQKRIWRQIEESSQ